MSTGNCETLIQISSDITSNSSAGIFGCVESCGLEGISGWLTDAGEPGRSLAIEVRAGGALLASGWTSIFRPDISAILDCPVKCGFHIKWNRNALLGEKTNDSPVNIVVSHSGRPIMNPGQTEIALADILATIPEAANGVVESVHGPFIRGKVLLSNSEQPINLWIENHLCATCYPHGSTSAVWREFLLVIPAELFDGHSRKIQVRSEDGALLENGEINIDGKHIGEGFIEKIGPESISGWAFSWRDPFGFAKLELLLNGKTIGSCLANRPRKDLGQLIYSNGFNGFEMRLPCTLSKDNVKSIDIRIEDSETVLPKIENVAKNLPEATLIATQSVPHGITGFVESIEYRLCKGWAFDHDNPDESLIVDVLLNGVLVTSTIADVKRIDLMRSLHTNCRHGFICELPYGVIPRTPDEISFRVRKNGHVLQFVQNLIWLMDKRTSHSELSKLLGVNPVQCKNKASIHLQTYKSDVLLQSEPSVDIIILNRNGAKHLTNLFSSFYKYNTWKNYTLTIIDHASTDNSHRICRKWEEKLNINLVVRNKNYSFAESCNYGAFNSKAELIFFLNNDIIFCQDILPGLVKHVRNGAAIAGIRLQSLPMAFLDNSSAFQELALFTQHTGVGFSWRFPERSFIPYELPGIINNNSFGYAATPAAAVTAGAMLVVRNCFIECGGFHEGYYYGYEDVDFCLYASEAKKLHIICANELTAYHSRGATRSFDAQSGRRGENSLLRKISRNFETLNQRFGFRLKGKRRNEWLMEPQQLGKEKAAVAILLPGSIAAAGVELWAAYELGDFLQSELAVDIVYVPEEHWYDLANIDLAISVSPGFNPEKISCSTPYLRLVAWPISDYGRWLRLPWLKRYDSIWTANEKARNAFEERTGRIPLLFPATLNPTRYSAAHFSPEYKADYIFIANITDLPPQILSELDPHSLPYDFSVYGSGWQNVAAWRIFWKGAYSYADLPIIYASTKIAIIAQDNQDGSVIAGLSVLAAITAGTLPIVRSHMLSQEFFEGLLPWFDNGHQLKKLISRYLANEDERRALIANLKMIVFNRHTFDRRASLLKEDLIRIGKSLRVTIDIGDAGLKGQMVERTLMDFLHKKGHLVRQPLQEALERQIMHGDDIRITIGRSKYKTDKSTLACGICLERSHSRLFRSPGDYDCLLVLNETLKKELPLPGVQALVQSDESIIEYEGLTDWHIIDLAAFQSRLEIWLDQVISECLDRQENIERLPAPETVPAPNEDSEKIVACFGIKKPTVIFWPYGSKNPYQDELYKGLRNLFDIREGTLAEARRLADAEEQVTFHLHWINPIMGANLPRKETERKIDAWLGELEAFVQAGGIFVWTIHNALSHECLFPDLEAKLYRKLGELASSIHLHSPKIIQLLPPEAAIPDDKSIIAPHGHYIEAYPLPVRHGIRKRFGIPVEARLIIFLGMIRGYKGVTNLLDSFNSLEAYLPAKPERPVWLLIAGEPQDIDMDKLRRQMPRQCVIEARRIPDEEVMEYLNAADFMALPYERILTSGSAMLALSAGLPVIAPKLGLLTEILEHGKNSILYSPDNPDGLRTALSVAALLPDQHIDGLKQEAKKAALKYPWTDAWNALSHAYAQSVGAKWEFIKDGEERERILVRRPVFVSNERTAIGIIHYGNLEDTMRAISSALGQGVVYVISNDADSAAFMELCAAYQNIIVIQSPRNLYYAGGNNVMIEMMIRDSESPGRTPYDYILLMNNDVELDSHTVAQLTSHMDADAKIAFGAPALVFGDNPERVWFCGAEIAWGNGMSVRHLHGGENIGDMPKLPFETGYVTGACLIARMTAIKQIGLMSEDFIMYFEETDWCLSAKKAGWKLMVFPDIVASHFKRSENNGLPTDLYLFYYFRNIFLITARHSASNMQEAEEFSKECASSWLDRISKIEPGRLNAATVQIEHGILEGRQIAQKYLEKSDK